MDIDSLDPEILNGLGRLYCDIWREPPWNEENWTIEGVIEDFKREMCRDFARAYIVRQNGDITGFAWGYGVTPSIMREISGHDQLDNQFEVGKVFYIDEWGVAKTERGQGIGRELFERFIAFGKRRDFSVIILRTNKKADRAKNVCRRLGFVELNVTDSQFDDRVYWALNLNK